MPLTIRRPLQLSKRLFLCVKLADSELLTNFRHTNESIMKNLIFAASLILVATAYATTSGIAISAKQAEGAKLGKSYGPYKVDVKKAITVKAMLADFSGKSERTEYTFEGNLVEICSKAGCWVNIDKGDGDTFMVRFKDHFTIPPATEVGTGAYLHGYAFMDTISVADLQHFAEDAGKSAEEIAAITAPKFKLNFEADGITLKK